MLSLANGDLLRAGTEAIVNTVNCVGVMGKGIALQFKQAFPRNFDAYQEACKRSEVQLGRMFVFDTGSMINPRWIINFPTKDHWKGRSRLRDIESGLMDLKRVIREHGIRSIAVPPLGCGNGGLDWTLVEPRIRDAFADMPEIEVQLFTPAGAPRFDQMRVATDKPVMTRGRALVLKLLGLYGAAGYRHSMLEVQKLTYFLQAAGENLRLGFRKYHYGPYAENLNHVLQRIEGHYIRGYGDRSKDAEIYVLEAGADEADRFLAQDEEAKRRLERVAELIEGFETPYGLELLSTVHWLTASEDAKFKTPEDVVQQVREWNARKAKMMKQPHVLAAWQQLAERGWLSKKAVPG
jgi:O-acetyl-ADP-ribose deacetylase (regulator of RNase III)